MGIFHTFRGIKGNSGKIFLINGDVPLKLRITICVTCAGND